MTTTKTPEQIIQEVMNDRAAEMTTTERMYFPENLAQRVAWFDNPGDPLALIVQCIQADREQRADELKLAEEWDTTLRILEGDGEEYTDTVLIRFTREWDKTLTREHTVSWETFVKALVVIASTEGEQG